MKKLLTIILLVTLSCFAGQLHINFNDGSSTVDVDFNDIENIEIVDSTIPGGMVFVQGGTFQMGDEVGDLWDECWPVHSVTLDDFNIGACEVTQKEWETYMPLQTLSNYGIGDNYPVYFVSWYEIMAYCNLRSMSEGIDPCYKIKNSTNPADWGEVPSVHNTDWDAVICDWSVNGYRLPTEAEFEYAARGGINHTDGYLYSGSDTIDDIAWYDSNSESTNPVGTKAPNQLGIYDMSGNLWEWCWDWRHLYTADADVNPTGPVTPDADHQDRILRGGYWNYNVYFCRVASRDAVNPCINADYGGFRVVRTN